MKQMFSRLDEMEKSIQLKSIRWAWAYSSLFLLVWSFYELSLINGGVNFLLWHTYEVGNILPIVLLLSQNLIVGLFQLVCRARMTSGKDEEGEKRSLKTAIITEIREGPSPKVVQVIMVIVIIIMAIRFLLGW